jgi:hypothetical protein
MKHLARQTPLAFLFLFIFSATSYAQKKSNEVFVDNAGIMRWGDTKEEVRGFGINYTAMFAHAHRTAERLGIPLEKAIDDDIYHFSRLGFDLFRVHVWDTEISDTLGNLLNNEHLKLFDYALSRMKERGMKFVITPIAFWGNGWPEPDEKTPGFSRKYGKDACLTNPDAIKAQQRYLFQFLNHVNSYTNIPYKSDPAIIAFEVSNEPHHREAPEKVTEFIKGMVKAMRDTGCKKPILYNISHSIHLVDAYFNADIQGGTFQWYPTGLGSGHELGGNLLVNVDRYSIPFAGHPKFKKSAKIVYEFDAADVGRSYIYPAMARSFREAGIQIATHFAYDPTYMADVNTEYGTHFMNLAYAPQKALGLMIASEVFHQIPMYKSYGTYPANASFGDFKVSYEHDLAELNSAEKFMYTNNTSTTPLAVHRLKQVAGFGTSPVVAYEGAGAYFLDQIENGVWRLEVMPDAIWIDDPFKRTSPKKKVAAIKWSTWDIKINIPDLSSDFSVKAINEGNSFSANAKNGTIAIAPGTYLLIRNGVTPAVNANSKWRNITLKEFAAPAGSLAATFVDHKPSEQLSAGKDYLIEALVVGDSIRSVEAFVSFGGWRPEAMKMERKAPYSYSVVIPADKIKAGVLRYYIVVLGKESARSFPSGQQTHPGDWDFYDLNPYKVPVVESSAPLYIFNAATDETHLSRQWVRGSSVIPDAMPGRAELQVNVEKLFREDPENKNANPVHDYSIRYFAGEKIKGRKADLNSKSRVILVARSLNNKPGKLQVALIDKDGVAVGSIVDLSQEKKEVTINLRDLKQVKIVTLPRPYPTFLPYYFYSRSEEEFDINQLESIQLSIGPGLTEQQLREPNGVAIESVRLE